MSKFQKILLKILTSESDKNIDFKDIVFLLQEFGFDLCIKGSHHIFYKSGINEIINIQPDPNNKAKPYQVKQVRNLIIRYKLGVFINE